MGAAERLNRDLDVLGIDFPGLVERWTARGLPLQPATSQALGAYRDNLRQIRQASLPDAAAAIRASSSVGVSVWHG